MSFNAVTANKIAHRVVQAAILREIKRMASMGCTAGWVEVPKVAPKELYAVFAWLKALGFRPVADSMRIQLDWSNTKLRKVGQYHET